MVPGDLALDLTLLDQRGVERSLTTFWDEGPVILFFYAAAMTPGCTKDDRSNLRCTRSFDCAFRTNPATHFGSKGYIGNYAGTRCCGYA